MGKMISVIVPVYNSEKFLKECLGSLLAQTYADIEIIAVNDGSTDNSAAILNEFADKDNRVKIVSIENHGVSYARNVGIDNAMGEYICFVDSDDTIEPDALKILFDDITDNNADISSCLMNERNHDGSVEIWKGEQPIVKHLEDDEFMYSSCAKLYRKSFLGDTRFENGRKIHEDSFFIFECCVKKPVFVARNLSVYNYRKNPQSASHSLFSPKFFDILYFADKKYGIITEEYPHLLDKAKNMLVKENLAMLNCFCNTKNKKYNKDIKECIKTVKTNKKYFVPAVEGDLKRFRIVKYNLYPLYRLVYRIKFRDRIGE